MMTDNELLRELKEWNAIHGNQAPQMFSPTMVRGGVLAPTTEEPYVAPTFNWDDDEDDDDDGDDEQEDAKPSKKTGKRTDNSAHGEEPYLPPVWDFSDRKPKNSQRTRGQAVTNNGNEEPYVAPKINWRTGEIEFG